MNTDESKATRKPSDEVIKRDWQSAVRVYQRSRLGQRVAIAIADRLEKSGVTETDIDRVMQ